MWQERIKFIAKHLRLLRVTNKALSAEVEYGGETFHYDRNYCNLR